MTAGNFEAKKWGYRQNQDGIVVSFLVHPDDISPEIACAPLGTHYMVAFAKIVDGQPEVIKPQRKDEAQKPKRAWNELSPTEQAGIRCADTEFMTFLREAHDALFTIGENTAAAFVQTFCKVKSRSEFNTDPKASARWKALDAQFLEWQTTQRYEGSRTK